MYINYGWAEEDMSKLLYKVVGLSCDKYLNAVLVTQFDKK